MDVMNAKQFIEYNKEAAPGSFETMLNQYYDGKTDTDWQDELFKTGVMQKYNIGAAGNNKNGSFFVSLGYMQNNGMIVGKNDLYKRFTAQLNATYNIKPWLEVGTNNSLSYIDANTISEGSAQYGQMATINKMDPLTPVVYSQVPSYVQDAINAGQNGKPLYQYDNNGVDKIYFAAGDMKFVDQNGDGEINEQDMVVIGDPNPDIYGNIFTTVAWKRLKLDVRFNYSLGNDIYNYQRSQLEGGSRFMNQSTALNRRWQAEGQVTDIPRISFQDPMGNSRFSDRWIEDGSYLRLKTATLSYDLPLNSEYIQGLQFWIQGNNLLTFTKYLGSDPEFSAGTGVLYQGIDMGNLAHSRTFTAGLKINL
jgi:hypothetical protein